MARLPKGRNVKWKITLPADLAGRIELSLMNRDLGAPIYGLRSRLIRELLQDYIAAGEPPLNLSTPESNNE